MAFREGPRRLSRIKRKIAMGNNHSLAAGDAKIAEITLKMCLSRFLAVVSFLQISRNMNRLITERQKIHKQGSVSLFQLQIYTA